MTARLPDYWLTRPDADVDERVRTAFEALLAATLDTMPDATLGTARGAMLGTARGATPDSLSRTTPGAVPDALPRATPGAAPDALPRATPGAAGCPTVRYTLPWPKWQFLCHLADHHDIALHGSGDPDIAQFEPRQPVDLTEFGNQKAVYAASDGLWAMFFAIVDRVRVPSVTNACIRVADETGTVHGPYYVFSVSRSALPLGPWRTGTVYLLPRSTFAVQPPMIFGPNEVHFAQLASSVPVRPLAKLTVAPADFPFLTQIRAHDDTRLQEYATALQTGAPWPDEP
jgi:hypothetical protein